MNNIRSVPFRHGVPVAGTGVVPRESRRGVSMLMGIPFMSTRDRSLYTCVGFDREGGFVYTGSGRVAKALR